MWPILGGLTEGLSKPHTVLPIPPSPQVLALVQRKVVPTSLRWLHRSQNWCGVWSRKPSTCPVFLGPAAARAPR